MKKNIQTIVWDLDGTLLNSFEIHIDVMTQVLKKHNLPVPNAVTLAQRAHIKGVRQILVTNRAHGIERGTASPKNIVDEGRLAGLIEKVICGDEVIHRKPSSQIFDDLSITIDPRTTLVIGDQFIDAQFAHNIGADCIIVRRDGSEIPHVEQLEDRVHENISRVTSLDEVKL